MPKTAQKRPQPKSRAKLIRRTPQKSLALARPEPPTIAEAIERVLITGDLSHLNPEQRLEYYQKVCQSLGLNRLTRPFDYIAFEGKLMLYARKDCTEQLRKIHGIAIFNSQSRIEGEHCIVTVEARDKTGRTDTGTGVVWIAGKKGKDYANALMIAETKAKRRATLSLAGLGMLDESELDTMEGYGTLTPSGRIMTTVEPTLSPAEQRYKEHEKENISRLSPAQQEVLNRKMAEAAARKNTPIDIQPPKGEPKSVPRVDGSMQPCLFWQHHAESDTWEIFGSDELKKQNRDLLAPLWNPTAHAIVCNAKQLGTLISQLEQRKCPIREYGAVREPGE
jgi:hypothetical protein